MNELYLSYIAGFFDGEGSITIGRRKKAKSKNFAYYAHVAIGQKDGEIIGELKKHFSGGIHKAKRDGSYVWYCSDRIAYNFIKTIYPYLRYKKPQAKLVLDLYEMIPTRSKFNMVSEQEIERRQLLYCEIRALKKVFTEPQYAGTTTERKNA